MEKIKDKNLINENELNNSNKEKEIKEELLSQTKLVNKKAKEFAKKFNAKTNNVEE